MSPTVYPIRSRIWGVSPASGQRIRQGHACRGPIFQSINLTKRFPTRHFGPPDRHRAVRECLLSSFSPASQKKDLSVILRIELLSAKGSELRVMSEKRGNSPSLPPPTSNLSPTQLTETSSTYIKYPPPL